MKQQILDSLNRGELLVDNAYRLGSDAWGEYIRTARELYREGTLDYMDEDDFFLLEGDAGELAMFEGKQVMLEVPYEDFDNSRFFVFVREDGVVSRIDFDLSPDDGYKSV